METKDSLRPWVRKVASVLGDGIVTNVSRVDHFLIFDEKGRVTGKISDKLHNLSEYLGFEVKGSDYIIDVAKKLKERR